MVRINCRMRDLDRDETWKGHFGRFVKKNKIFYLKMAIGKKLREQVHERLKVVR